MSQITDGEARQALVAEVCEIVSKRYREPMLMHDTTALDNAARALVLALAGPPKPTTIINFREFLMTREFHHAFMDYAGAHGLKVR